MLENPWSREENFEKIVVVMPFRGEINELQEAVGSVRQSTLKNFRLLVIDDRPGEIDCPTFLAKDEYFRSYGQGLPKVIEMSKSHISEQYVALLAGDDLMESNRLELQLAAIKKFDSEICLSGMQKFSLRQKKLEMLTGSPRIETFTKLWLLLGAYGADGTIFMTSKFYKEEYILDPSDSYSDWAIALEKYPSRIAYVSKDLVFYRQHANQTTRNNRNNFLTSSVFPAWSRVYAEFFESNPSIEVFLILAAPWFRSKIQPADIFESKIYSKEILTGFKSGNFTTKEIRSAESLIIRRYLFRIKPRCIIPIFLVLFSLSIEHPIRRVSLEAIKIAKTLLQQSEIKPRTVRH
jgi:glycosyltransferase involved in cell wall biosynthesis